MALPRNLVLTKAFGGMEQHRVCYRPKARILECCDVLNAVRLQAFSAPYKKSRHSLLKCRAALEISSTKTEESIRQGFHGKVMPLSLGAINDERIRTQGRAWRTSAATEQD